MCRIIATYEKYEYPKISSRITRFRCKLQGLVNAEGDNINSPSYDHQTTCHFLVDQWHFNRKSYIFIQENAFEYFVCKMPAILYRSPSDIPQAYSQLCIVVIVILVVCGFRWSIDHILHGFFTGTGIISYLRRNQITAIKGKHREKWFRITSLSRNQHLEPIRIMCQTESMARPSL